MTQSTVGDSQQTQRFTVDPGAVDRLVAGTIEPAEEQALANQVAEMLFAHRGLPNATMGALSHIERHLGGGGPMLQWLAGFDGMPKTVAAIAMVGDLLDRLSGDADTVGAVHTVLSREPVRDSLAGHVVDSADSTSLGSLSYRIESIAGRGRLDEAARLARAVLDLLAEAAGEQPTEGLAREAGRVAQARALLG